MKVLVIGGGGREHALCWKLASGDTVEKVYCAPGNAGMASVAECVDIQQNHYDELADFAETNQIDLTVVGPEAPLCGGVVDVFRKRNLKIFGPDHIAAKLEGSKTFAKDFMVKYQIPTAESADFTDPKEAYDYIDAKFASGINGLVIKADGLAAGKGVTVAARHEVATAAAEECFKGTFGAAGDRLLIEELLEGEEASILALVDGDTVLPLASSQDHKRLMNGDQGPNTGGMGAYSPAPVVDAAMMARIKSEVLDNFARGIKAEGLDFRGVIYAGIMATEDGPKVLEFNVRFGDPEIQAVLVRLESDLADALMKTVDRKLSDLTLRWSDDPSVCVVMASGGYPAKYAKGHVISGLVEAESDGAVVFHAGTRLKDGEIVNAGGRVLGVTAKGGNIANAVANAYEAVEKIHWKDVFYRLDIAHRALNR